MPVRRRLAALVAISVQLGSCGSAVDPDWERGSPHYAGEVEEVTLRLGRSDLPYTRVAELLVRAPQDSCGVRVDVMNRTRIVIDGEEASPWALRVGTPVGVWTADGIRDGCPAAVTAAEIETGPFVLRRARRR